MAPKSNAEIAKTGAVGRLQEEGRSGIVCDSMQWGAAMLYGLHHVQLAMPARGEPAARDFYGRLLGLDEVAKPADLAARGGAWFERGAVRIHLGIEEPFRPARKAHPAFLVSDLTALCARLEEAGHTPRPDDALPGYDRVFVDDPFGNRIELLEPARDRAFL